MTDDASWLPFGWGQPTPDDLLGKPLPPYYGPTGTETTAGMQSAAGRPFDPSVGAPFGAPQFTQSQADALHSGMQQLAQLMPGFVGGIKAFHGSPHDFSAFDMSKIGTGEGSQAYGHGLYFAENEGVAKSYKSPPPFGEPDIMLDGQKFSLGDLSGVTEPGAQDGLQYLWEAGFDPAKALKKASDSYGWATPEGRTHVIQAIKWIEDNHQRVQEPPPPPRPPGHMYQVDINADPSKMLDWDKPLNQQPQVQAALANHPDADLINEAGHQISGQTLWDILRAGDQGAAGATQGLKQAGIPGIKYLDAGSRSGGAGTSNYVMFDDKLVSILRKYGLAGLTTGAAAAPFGMPQTASPGTNP